MSTHDEFAAGVVASPWLRMAHITRFSSLPVLNRESVAEHSFFVSLLALLMALDLRERKGEDIPLGPLLARATVHDLDEALTGDFIRPFKYSSDALRRALHDSAAAALRAAVAPGPGAEQLEEWWTAAKDSSITGHLVHLADLWSCTLFARREVLMGNVLARRVLVEVNAWVSSTEWHPLVRPYAAAVSRQCLEGYRDGGLALRAGAEGELIDPVYQSMISQLQRKDLAP